MNAVNPGLVALTTGGTGGHMFPAQAVARELLGRGVEVMLITDRRGGGFGADSAQDDLAQVECHQVNAGGIAGGSPLKKAKSLLSLALGTLQARRLLKRRGARVVVGFGSYASVPAVMAGASLGTRIVLHEQNAVLGRANRLLARHAALLATSFDHVEAVPAASRARIRVTGNPVRNAIVELGQRPFSLPGDDERLSLLVTGGSQGAQVFNTLVPKAIGYLPAALRQRLKVTQQTPGPEWESVAQAYDQTGVEAVTAPFFEDLPQRLAAAQLVICRAGASTVAELTAAGRPAILVPYPHATDDHQSANARALAEAGGAWVMPQSALDPKGLADRLQSLLSAPSLLARAAQCARSMARTQAALHLADLVCGLDRPSGGSKQDSETQSRSEPRRGDDGDGEPGAAPDSGSNSGGPSATRSEEAAA